MIRRKCPLCGKPRSEKRLDIQVTPLQALVFDIIEGNPDGIDSCLVLERFRHIKPDTHRKTIHVYVSQLNDLFAGTGYRINKYRNDGELYWVYYLEKPPAVGSGPSRQSI